MGVEPGREECPVAIHSKLVGSTHLLPHTFTPSYAPESHGISAKYTDEEEVMHANIGLLRMYSCILINTVFILFNKCNPDGVVIQLGWFLSFR